ncbi:MAG: ADP-ribosyl-[dinitrogen reductase] hydrolase [Methyloversatilis discipulorum]|uniref:ADP-ribosyl-[dinitrogen reductase] hydrolase n=1 Tax=Methyloversatilis discipulorum TaxID=1119528 RepID=UPI0026ED53C2|nr:ADP-ribosyl-[dinitrogen reductase] hydrolase [Methyloversatilis discipulorum]MBT9517952.1 ADP-ribosyl-[dinitrogen reductase] hydrolase [Methyloversatilis discipulorum]
MTDDFDTLYDRALGAYLGLAIGDALGATVEFMRPREIRAQYGEHRDIVGGGWLRLARGQVTDDTTMCLALGDALLEVGGARLASAAQAGDDELAGMTRVIADAFVGWLRGKPVDCGNTCRRGLQRYLADGSLSGLQNERDGGNGALMRNLPTVLALWHDAAALERVSLAQARITHHHPLSDAATVGFARLLARLLSGASHDDGAAWVADWVQTHPAFAFQPYPGRATAYVVDTVQTVLYHFVSHADFETALIATVNMGDDADTTGALVGMLAGALCGARALPERWLSRLQRDVVMAITDQTSGLLAMSRRG